MESKLVKKLWWEGNNLNIITEDGKHWIFKNASYTNMDFHFENDDNITVERIPVIDGKIRLDEI